MLFFVYTDEAAALARARLFVRRRQPHADGLPPDLRRATEAGGDGDSAAARVDWRASVLLMVVLHTAYRLSLVTSADAELLNAFVEDGGGPARGPASSSGGLGGGSGGGSGANLDSSLAARVHQVTEVVHASPR